MENNSKSLDTTPIGIFLVGGILLGGFFPMMAGYVTPAASPLIAGIIIASAIVFIILMVVEIGNRNLFGALVNGVFGVLLGLAPGLVFFFAFLAQGMGVEVDPRIIGFYFFYVSFVLLVVGFVAGYMFWHFTVVFWGLAVMLVLMGMVFAGYLSHTWNEILAWPMLAGGLYFAYMGAATFLAGMLHKPVLPLGGPLFKAKQ